LILLSPIKRVNYLIVVPNISLFFWLCFKALGDSSQHQSNLNFLELEQVQTRCLASRTACAMCSALGWEATVRHNHIECEATWHVPVVMQPSEIHGEEEAAKLQFVVDKFVFQLPLKSGLGNHKILWCFTNVLYNHIF